MKKIRTAIKLLPAVLLVAMMLLAAGCEMFGQGNTTTAEATSVGITTSDTSAVTPETTATPHDTTAIDTGVITLPPVTTGEPEVTTDPAQRPKYIDPLTGLEGFDNLSMVRPVSIVIDNVSAAAPQSGLSLADILIECMVEGGTSRLIMITNNYSGLEVYGPVRSTRHYMVSLSQAFDTLMVGAGYSPQGYTAIKDGELSYIDGTHDRYALSGFYRDVNRFNNSGYEHSLMITGSGIVKLAAINGFAIDTDKVADAFNFASPGREVVLTGGTSTHIILPYSSYQQVQLIYSRTAGTYYRYQFGDTAHLDASNGEQLNFKNVFILFTKSERIEGDTEGRLNIAVTGSGTGYYVTGGRYTAVNWSRESDTAQFVFTAVDGAPLYVNRGTTFISVVSDTLTSTVQLNYKLN